jgi:hypothetical protein
MSSHSMSRLGIAIVIDPAAGSPARFMSLITPYFRNHVAADRERIAEMTAAQAGAPAPAADSLIAKLTVPRRPLHFHHAVGLAVLRW